MLARAARTSRSIAQGGASLAASPLVTIIGDGNRFTDADSNSARSFGMGTGWALPSVLSGLSGHC